MKKFLVIIALVASLVACTSKNEPEQTTILENTQVYGSWVYYSGNIKSLYDNVPLVNHSIKINPNGSFQENYTTIDTAGIVYGNWSLSDNKITFVRILTRDTVIRPVKMVGGCLQIGQERYMLDTAFNYEKILVGSWYHMNYDYDSYWQLNEDKTLVHYFSPITPIETEYGIWKFENKNLYITINGETFCYPIEFANDTYGKCGGELFKKSK